MGESAPGSPKAGLTRRDDGRVGKHMFLTNAVAAVVMSNERFAPGVGIDEQVALSQALADEVLAMLVSVGVPADVFSVTGNEAAQFALDCLVVDRVRLYALGLGSAPTLSAMPDEAQQLWVADEGRRIAGDWVRSMPAPLAQVDVYRQDLVLGELSPRGLERAQVHVRELVADLVGTVVESVAGGAGRRQAPVAVGDGEVPDHINPVTMQPWEQGDVRP